MRKLAIVLFLGVWVAQALGRGQEGPTSRAAYDALDPPILRVAGGQLRGYVSDGTFAFVGIRYATAARFEMPQARRRVGGRQERADLRSRLPGARAGRDLGRRVLLAAPLLARRARTASS